MINFISLVGFNLKVVFCTSSESISADIFNIEDIYSVLGIDPRNEDSTLDLLRMDESEDLITVGDIEYSSYKSVEYQEIYDDLYDILQKSDQPFTSSTQSTTSQEAALITFECQGSSQNVFRDEEISMLANNTELDITDVHQVPHYDNRLSPSPEYSCNNSLQNHLHCKSNHLALHPHNQTGTSQSKTLFNTSQSDKLLTESGKEEILFNIKLTDNLVFTALFNFNLYTDLLNNVGIQSYIKFYHKILVFLTANILDIKLDENMNNDCIIESVIPGIILMISTIKNSDCSLPFLARRDEDSGSALYALLKREYPPFEFSCEIFRDLSNKIRNIRWKTRGFPANPNNTRILTNFVYQRLRKLSTGIESLFVKQTFLLIISNPSIDLVYKSLYKLLAIIDLYFKDGVTLSENQYYSFLSSLFRGISPPYNEIKFSETCRANKIFNKRVRLQENLASEDTDFAKTTFTSLLFRSDFFLRIAFCAQPQTIREYFKKVELSCAEVLITVLKKNKL